MKYLLLVAFIGISLQAMEEKQIKQTKKYNRISDKKIKEPKEKFLKTMLQFLAQIEQEEEMEKKLNCEEEKNLFYSIFN